MRNPTPAVVQSGSRPVLFRLPPGWLAGCAMVALVSSCDLVDPTDPTALPPHFSTAGNVSVPEDAGPQTFEGWASGLDTGSNELEPGAGFVVVTNSNEALFDVAPTVSFPDGDLTFTTAADANGIAEMGVELDDGAGGRFGAVVLTIEVLPVNDPPSFTGGNVEGEEDARYEEPWATGLSAGPPDEADQALSFEIVGITNEGLFAVGPSVSSDGTLSFAPATDAYGTADVAIRLSDDGGTDLGGQDTTRSAVTFTIDVRPVNDRPAFAAGPEPTVVEDAGAQRLAGWASAITAGAGESFGDDARFTVETDSDRALFESPPAIDLATGDLTFTALPDASGTADVTIALSDGHGGISDQAVTTITVRPVNDAPTFAGGDVTVEEDDGEYAASWATGVAAGPADEANQSLAFTVTENTNEALFSVVPTVSADGVLAFSPAAHAHGAAGVTVQLIDDGGTADGGVDRSPPVSFTIAVSAANDPPSFEAGEDPSVLEDSGPRLLAAWATSIDPGEAEVFGDGAGFTIVSNSNPALFAAGPALEFPSGDLAFTPAPDANGTAEVVIELADGDGADSDRKTARLRVVPVNDAPDFVGGDVAVDEDSGDYSGAWASGVTPGPADEAGQALTFSVIGNTDESLFAAGPSVAADGTLTFTPAPGAFGAAEITVSLRDDGGTADGGDDAAAPVTFTIAITASNDPPSFTAGGDVGALEDAGPQVVSDWATAIDPGPGESFADGAGFVVTDNSNPGLFSAGPAVDLASGALSFTPAVNVSGTAELMVELRDGDGGSSAAVDVSITVSPVNDAPTVAADAIAVDEDSGAYEAALASPGPDDESGQTLAVTVAANSNASLFAAGPAVGADGRLSFTPAEDAFGEAELTLELTDDGGTAGGGVDAATETVVIRVESVNDAPVITAHLPAGSTGDTTTVHSPREAADTFDLIAPRDATSIVYPELIEAIAGPSSEAGQTLSLSVEGGELGGGVSAGALELDLPDDAWDSEVIEVRAVDDGGTDRGGDDTSVLPLRVLRSEGPSGEAMSVTGDEGSICVPITLTGTFFRDMRDMDGDGDEEGRLRIVSAPSDGIFTTDSGIIVTAGGEYAEWTFCFIPDTHGASTVSIVDGEEVLDVYTTLTYRVVDDLGDSSDAYVVEIYIRPEFF